MKADNSGRHDSRLLAKALACLGLLAGVCSCSGRAASDRAVQEPSVSGPEHKVGDIREMPLANEAVSGFGLYATMPAFAEEAKAGLSFPMAWRHARESRTYRRFERWKEDARELVFGCMGQLPAPAQDFECRVLARERREGYEAFKIVFNVDSYCRTAAYLLVPDGEGPFPALLALHDHGAHFTIGKEKMIRPMECDSAVRRDRQSDLTVWDDAAAWSVACYDGVFTGDFFARNGYVVLATDALFWGERGRQDSPLYDAQQAMASNLFQLGMNWGGLILFEDMESARFLASLPFVDDSKIGCYGHSMGGYRSWNLAAMSDVVKASVNVCWFCTTEYLMTQQNNQSKGGSAYSMLLPDVRRWLDYPDVASLACPKPAFFMNGRYDKLFPVEGTEDAYDIVREVYESQNAGENLRTAIYGGPHFFSMKMQQDALTFFNEFFL